MADAHREELVLSYYRVRQALGIMGLLLPALLILGGLVSLGGVEPSISDYYHTILRDLYVGTLTAIAVFLIAYPGHLRTTDEWLSDDIITTIAGIAALGVAFLPNEPRLGQATLATVTQQMLGAHLAAIGHYVSAVIFLGGLGTICLRKFARTASPGRRRIYRGCGWIILAMTLATLVASWFKIRGPAGPQAVVNDLMLVLWCEAIAVWAFAVAWLVKGRADLGLARLVHRRPRDPANLSGPPG